MSPLGSSGSGDTILDYVFYAFLLCIVLYGIYAKRRAMTAQDGPILASDAMLGTTGLQSMAQGTMAGFEYNLLTNDAGRVMYFVQLGHDTKLHLIAYGSDSEMSDNTKSFISKKWLEPVSLEGDFPKSFQMYCNPEAQSEIREVFAPDVMAQFADFCRAYDFELFRETLYVSRARGAVQQDDTTSLTTDLEVFLRNNTNVLARLQNIPSVTFESQK